MGPTRGVSLLAHAPHAWASLRRQPARAAACIIVLSIGIAGLLCVRALLDGARRRVIDQVESMGATAIFVRGPQSFFESPSARDALREIAMHDQVREVASLRERSSSVWLPGSRGQLRAQVLEASPAFFASLSLGLAEGRGLAAADAGMAHGVVGVELARRLRVRVGDRVMVDGLPIRVVGVLDRRAALAEPDGEAQPIAGGNSARNVDQAVLVSPRTRGLHESSHRTTELIVLCRTSASVPEVATLIRRSLPAAAAAGVEFVVPLELLSTRSWTERLLAVCVLIVTALTAGSVAGGVGAVLLMSIHERRSELAIRRALGARRGDIRAQVLLEGAILVVGGAGLGVMLALVVLGPASGIVGVPALLTPWNVASVTGGASIVGLLACLAPAQLATTADPARDLIR